MRRARKEREERAAFIAVQAILTPAWIKSMTLVQAISEGTTPSQIEADPRLFQAVQSIACILESLGYAAFALMVGSFERSPRAAGRYASPGANCAAMSNTHVSARVRKNCQWFQCLAEQIDRHSKAGTSLTPGAHEAYRDWR